MYVYTANAFPYGAFKGTVVKEQVYEPDWRTEERTQYTMPSPTSWRNRRPRRCRRRFRRAPLGFKPNVTGPDVVASYTEHVLRVAAHLVEIEERTGRTGDAGDRAGAALLPRNDRRDGRLLHEPPLLRQAAATARRSSARIPISEAHVALRRHLGIVFDIGHQAVGFEHIPTSLQKLVDAGIPIFKLQEVAAMHIPRGDSDKAVEALRAIRQDGLPVADGRRRRTARSRSFSISRTRSPRGRRIPVRANGARHFHVPVFLDDLGPFRTTRFALEEALTFHKATPLSRQLEIETYTWDVLPDISRLATSSTTCAGKLSGCGGNLREQ